MRKILASILFLFGCAQAFAVEQLAMLPVPATFWNAGLSTFGKPLGITITSQILSLANQSDIPSSVWGAGWTADVTFSGLGAYGATASVLGSTPSNNGTCVTTGLCTNSAFSTAGGAPQWSSQGLFSAYSAPITIQVTRPAYTAVSIPSATTKTDPVLVTSPLRQPFPNPIPIVGKSGVNPVVAVALNKAIFANDTTSTATAPGGVYWDGSNNSIASSTISVTNSSTRAYPAIIGNWITERDTVYDGTAAATVEFFGGHAYSNGAKPLAGVTIIMGDAGTAATASGAWTTSATTIVLTAAPTIPPAAGAIVNDTTTGLLVGTVQSYTPTPTPTITLTNTALSASSGSSDALSITHTVSQTATLQQSTRLPSSGCTATNNSNVLTNCGSAAWAKVGQRVNVVSTQNATATASGPISTGSATFAISGATSTPVAGQAVFDATGQLAIGTVQSYSAPTVTLTANAANAGSSGDALVFSGGGVRGQPVIGQIDTSATANCPSGTATNVCLELFVQQTATFNTDGSLTIAMATAGVSSALLPINQALADGAFLGGTLTEVGAGGLWSTATHKIVAPYGVSSDVTHGLGNVTTLPTPVQGQWLAGMYVYDAAATPCIKTDVYSQVSPYISTYVPGGASTLAPAGAVLSTCGSGAPAHTLTGLGIAAAPGSTTATTISISTDATTATGGTDTVQINHQFFGASGGVTITAGNPVPVWSATFPAASFSGLTPGQIYFRAIGYPLIGDQLLDSDSPTTIGADVATTSAWAAGATSILIKNCSGVIFTSQLSVEVVDTTTGQNVGIATSCTGSNPATLTLSSGASNGGYAGDLLAVGSNVECDDWFVNIGASLGFAASGHLNGVAQSCVPSNPAWFGHGLVNAQKVSPNLHNLWAYYDKAASQSYAWRYLWINSSGTCTTSACVQTGLSDPGTTANYVASLATAVNIAKSYNGTGRTVAHGTDINGFVFVLMPTGSPWAHAAMTAVTNLTPPPVIESAPSGGSATPPGVAAPIVATLRDGVGGQNITALRLQNVALQQIGTSNAMLRGTDSETMAAFPVSHVTLDNVAITPQVGSPQTFQQIGPLAAYNVIDNSGTYTTSLLSSSSVVLGLVAGSTINCGGSSSATASSAITTGASATFTITTTTLAGPNPAAGDAIYDTNLGAQVGTVTSYSAGTVTANITTADASASGKTIRFAGYKKNATLNMSFGYGNDLWLCGNSAGASILPTATFWPNSQIWAYDRFMGILNVAGPWATVVQAQNTLLTHDVFEAINVSVNNQECLELGGDSFIAPLLNVAVQNTTCTGGRLNENYIEGFGIPGSVVASGGALATGTYYAEIAYSRAANPTVVSSVDSAAGTPVASAWSPQVVTIGTANSSVKYTPPCDFTELANIFVSGTSTVQAGPQLASFTISSASGTSMVLTTAPTLISPVTGLFLSNGSSLVTTAAGAPIYVTNCPGGTCGAVTGTYTLSGTPSPSLSTSTTYYFVAGQPTNLADVAQITATSSGTAMTVTAITGNLYVGATLATSGGVVTGSGVPVRIAACPVGGCGVTGAYTLTVAPTSPLSGSYNAQATGLTMCQNISIVAVDPLTNIAPVASSTFPNRSYFKDPWTERANVWTTLNLKADYFTGAMPNGGRLSGNAPRRWAVDVSDSVYETNVFGGYYFSYSSQGGEVTPFNTWYNLNGAIFTDNSAVRFTVGDDRSYGTGAYPGLNIGMGGVCPTTSSILPTTTATIVNGARMAGRTLAGDAQWPFDIEGNPHFATLPGFAGACEMGGF